MLKRLFLALLAGALVMMCAAAPAGAAPPTSWRRADLQPATPTGMDFLIGVNDRGDASGFTYTSDFHQRPIIRYGTGNLTVVGEPSWTEAILGRINNRGQAAGLALTATDEVVSFVYDHGSIRRLPVDGTSITINDDGVVGVTTLDSRPVLVEPGGGVRALEVPAGLVGTVSDVANGDIASGSVGGPTEYGTPVVWSPSGTITYLPVPPDCLGETSAVNRFGDAVGDIACWDGSVRFHYAPALWHAGVLTLLPTTDYDGVAMDINDDGTIVGYLRDANSATTRAALWQGGKLVDVDARTTPRSSAVHELTAISSRGTLAGFHAPDGGAVVYTAASGLVLDLSVGPIASLPPSAVPRLELRLNLPGPLNAIIDAITTRV